MAKLFVANISFKATEEGIQNLFESSGFEVDKVQIICDRDTGKSKGYGFVTLVDTNQSDDAIRQLNDAVLDGRKIVVKEAQPMREREQSAGGRGRY